MTVGIPGTGIGGLFYILAALLLPLRGLFLRCRHIHVAWKRILKKSALALGVLLGIWTSGWLIGLFLGPTVRTAAQAFGRAGQPVGYGYENVVRWAMLISGFAVLAIILLLTQLARILFKPKREEV